ncbi:MAG: hypothetical protein KF744_13310 [Taibaiella sp.]|nr:hypothetical protein [Taibaiella sp.]
MKKIVSVIAILIWACLSGRAQTGDPTTWTYEVKKKGANEYQLIAHLSLKMGWHIWSLKPGGDGFQIVPAFVFDKNAAVELKGEMTEKGHATTTTMEGVDGKVTYLSGQVDYIQNVKVKGKGVKVTGKHTYQVCDDKSCLAPVDKDFVFEIK